MGKIIEFKSERDLDIGTVLWAVGKKDIRKYKPCPICDNERTIKVTDTKGNEYNMLCPRCTERHTKCGDWEDFKHYKEVTHSISGFNLSIDYYGQIKQKIMLCKHRKDEGYYVGVAYITNFENLTSNSCKTTTQFYFSKQEAKAEAERLNAEQAALIKEFLEGGE